MSWGPIVAGGAAGWLLGGKFHSSRIKKKLDEKHKKEQKALYKQYYNDVYALQQQNADLVAAVEQYGLKVQR
jgi:membrane protein YqaA with SNARE-associated domain